MARLTPDNLYQSSRGRERINRILAVTWIMLAASPIYACLWTYGTDVHGHRAEVGGFTAESYVRYLTDHKHDRAYWETECAQRKKKVMSEPGYKSQNDYAVALAHLGEYDQALGVLEVIEKEHPGLYATASNLGTLFELRGDNAKALEWIQEGMRRNQESHYGTEWLHVKILEAKIAMAKNPDWLKSNSVLGFDFGNDVVTKKPSQSLPNTRFDEDSLAQAIEYQLRERLQFVEPPDPIVGDLLIDLGNVNSLVRSVEYAIPVYEFGLKYGTPHGDLVRRRIAHFQALVAANASSGESAHAWIDRTIYYGLAAAATLVLLGCLLLWRWWRHARAVVSRD